MASFAPLPSVADPPPSRSRAWAAPRRTRLAWPLPALLAWALAWGVQAALRRAGFDAAPALLLAALVPLAGSALLPAGTAPWRHAIVAGGFPLLALAGGLGGALPSWTWGLALALLWLAYPRRAWRDAPMFPTPAQALQGLGEALKLPAAARVLDAGCGMGHGLQALQRALPQARLHGTEWSWPLRLLAAWRCPAALVTRGDMWAEDWGRYDLVYLFQRPESMARAWQKASEQMRPGSWLASLEFAVPDLAPTLRLPGVPGKPVWLYRVPGGPAQSRPQRADNSREASPRARSARRGRPET